MVENLSSSSSRVFGGVLSRELNGWRGDSVQSWTATTNLAAYLAAFDEVFGNDTVKITRLNPNDDGELEMPVCLEALVKALPYWQVLSLRIAVKEYGEYCIQFRRNTDTEFLVSCHLQKY